MDMLVLNMPEKVLLRVLNAETDETIILEDRYFELGKEFFTLSNLSRVITAAPQITLPTQYFGRMNTKTWCYFYEKAELSNQNQNWGATIGIYTEAQSLGLNPEANYELLPIVRAFMEKNDFETALNLSDPLTSPDSDTLVHFCSFWKENINRLSTRELKDRATNLLKSWHCEVPYYE